MRFFGGGDTRGSDADKQRIPRHSSGWIALRSYLKENEGLRVLDIGATSATNINLLTGMGHSIYMADLIAESQSPAWQKSVEGAEAPVFDVPGFLKANLSLGDRLFDVVLFWDVADYLPASLNEPLLQHIHSMMAPGGRLLAFGHVKPEDGLHRYHLREDDQVDAQRMSSIPVRAIYTNRQMEALLAPFSTYRFFLAKDNLREVLVNR